MFPEFQNNIVQGRETRPNSGEVGETSKINAATGVNF